MKQAQQGQRGLWEKGIKSNAPRVTTLVWQEWRHQRNGANTPAWRGQQCWSLSMTAMPPLLQGQQHQLDDYASLTMAKMPSWWGQHSPLQWWQRCPCINGSTITTRATMSLDDTEDTCTSMMTMTPLQQGQYCQLEDGNDASGMRATMPLRIKGNGAFQGQWCHWGCKWSQTGSFIHVRHLQHDWANGCCLTGNWEHTYTNTQAKLAQDFEFWGNL